MPYPYKVYGGSSVPSSWTATPHPPPPPTTSGQTRLIKAVICGSRHSNQVSKSFLPGYDDTVSHAAPVAHAIGVVWLVKNYSLEMDLVIEI